VPDSSHGVKQICAFAVPKIFMAVKDHSMNGSSRSSSSVSGGSDTCGPDTCGPDTCGPEKDVEKNEMPTEEQPLCNGNALATNKSKNLRVLSNCQRLSYGVGHVLNDLTASMWFSYMLVFLHQVNKFNNSLSGILILIGQISDAVFTPFIGFESDRTSGIKKIGKRKTWHLLGTLCVMISFPFLFTNCITCSHAPDIAQFVYFAPFIVIFQFGWASTQISHLSFSSDYTPHRHERVTLQSIRNMFAVIANLSVFGIFLILFYIQGSLTTLDSGELGAGDAPKFQTLALLCIGIGTVTNFIFHFGTKEKSDSNDDQNSNRDVAVENSIEQSTVLHSKMSWIDWLKEHQFYQVAVLYMATRLYINVSQVFFPMYLLETIFLDKKSIALLPLVTYCSSFLVSLSASHINKFLGRKMAYVVAVAVGLSSCAWMYFIPGKSDQVYGAAVLLGAAGSLLLITSLSMTSDLISANTESGAFVFGAMSFTDKLSNGLAVFLIQTFHPCSGCCPACEYYYRYVQVLVPGGALVIGFIALLTLIPQDIGARVKAEAVLKVMENHASGINYSSTNSIECTCGSFTIPSGTCSSCGKINPNNLTHNVQVHRHFDTDEISDDSTDERPLLGSSVASINNDLRCVTDYGSVRDC
jgi:Na+/melibiose symporter-like transporter